MQKYLEKRYSRYTQNIMIKAVIATYGIPGIFLTNILLTKKEIQKKDENIVEICHTGFDDELFYDFRHYHEETNECDIFIQWPGGEPKIYARTFYEFLCKRIKVYMN